MIHPELYQRYLSALLAGDRSTCNDIIQDLLDQKINIKRLYLELIQESLYEVGRRWEKNQISVAREHLATAMTESLLNLIYPHLFAKPKTGKKSVISCSPNEYHQVGGKIIADIFEMNGWDSHFLGANTPIEHLLSFIEEVNPDVVGLSISIYFNIPVLKNTISEVNAAFPTLDIFIGGQAFHWGTPDVLKEFKKLLYIPSIDDLEQEISRD